MMLLILGCGFEPTVPADPPTILQLEAVPLEICINEFMPDNETALSDELGAKPDWIELMNPQDERVLLGGWTIGDDRSDPEPLDESLEIAPGGSIVLFADGSPERGTRHLSFGLDADGGELALFAPDGRGSVVTYGFTSDDFAVARKTDCCSGASCFEHVWQGSPGASNP